MPAALELGGRVFGRLTIIGRAGKDRWGGWLWDCRCSCGRVVTVRASTLATGRTSQCLSCSAKASGTTHGQTGTELYLRWRAMLARCENEKNPEWHNYGGRGIKICREWRTYEAFARDMGPTFDPDLEIDRIDNDGNYEPGNCRWSTRQEQQNNRRNNHVIEWRGQVRTVTEWASLLGIKPNTLIYRLRRGWDIERAMTFRVPRNVLLEVANG